MALALNCVRSRPPPVERFILFVFCVFRRQKMELSSLSFSSLQTTRWRLPRYAKPHVPKFGTAKVMGRITFFCPQGLTSLERLQSIIAAGCGDSNCLKRALLPALRSIGRWRCTRREERCGTMPCNGGLDPTRDVDVRHAPGYDRWGGGWRPAYGSL